MSSITHAENELRILLENCEPDERESQEHANREILAVMNLLASQGHSGYSIGYVLELVRKLANHQPLTPLTGEDSEWMEVGGGPDLPMFQNKRQSSVFKDGKDGQAYDINGRAFIDPEFPNSTYTRSVWGWSKIPVNFPYMPQKTVIVELDENSEPRDPVMRKKLIAEATRFGFDLVADWKQCAISNEQERQDRIRRELARQNMVESGELARVVVADPDAPVPCTCPSTECTRSCGK